MCVSFFSALSTNIYLLSSYFIRFLFCFVFLFYYSCCSCVSFLLQSLPLKCSSFIFQVFPLPRTCTISFLKPVSTDAISSPNIKCTSSVLLYLNCCFHPAVCPDMGALGCSSHFTVLARVAPI